MVCSKFQFILIVAIFQLSCKGKEILVPSPSQPVINGATIYKTNKEGTILLNKIPAKIPYTIKVNDAVDINVDISLTRQKMEGFGAALTGSSAYVLMNNLSASQRTMVLKDLFSTQEGIGINYLRLTIGASDFSLSDFTYNETTGNVPDTNLNNFSIAVENEYLIPALMEILAINPQIHIMSSPWSAPAWMKINKSLKNGGRVDAQFYKAYANYFVKYIQAFQQHDIQIDAITIQNEPLYAAPYMSTEMSAQEQITFINTALVPAFKANGIQTKIIIYDHNWDNINYPLSVLSNVQTRNSIAGTAFHCYAGSVTAMQQVAVLYPNHGIYFTECSGGDFSKDFGNNLAWNSENLMIGAPRSSAKTVLFWNLALDETSGPKNGGCQDCRGVITVPSGGQLVKKNVEYYLLGHASKFVQYQAQRIETPSTRNNGISHVAYLNPDGSKVLLAFNHNETPQKIQVIQSDRVFSYSIEPGSLVTFIWD
jgi:glucosylceramidase